MIQWPVQPQNKKYEQWYYKLIQRAQQRILTPEQYVEIHHIVPRSFGGNNNSSNLATLTAREHFIAHALLWKMKFPNPYGRKMCFAASVMANKVSSSKKRNYKINSRLYESIKLEFSIEMSQSMIGEDNHFYGKKHSAETKKKFAEYHSRPEVKQAKSERIKGDNNPAKRPDIQDKISRAQLERMAKDKELGTGSYSESCRKKHSENNKGSKNARAKQFKFTDKDNNVYMVNGGLKDFCLEHNISVGWAWKFLRGSKTDLYNGWKVEDLSSDPRIAVNKDGEQKFAKKSELDQLIASGWQIGCKSKQKRKLSLEEIQKSHAKRKETLEKKRTIGIFSSLKGKTRNPDSVRKGADKRKGKPSPLRGRKVDPEVIAKILATKKANGGFKGLPGALNPMYGKPRSEETKAKIRATKLANKLAKLENINNDISRRN